MKYLLAHDLGTSGNKAVLYTIEGKPVKSAYRAYSLNSNNNNWAEQNPLDWWKAVCEASRELVFEIDPSDIAAISFSAQMMGCLCVDRYGKPLRDAMIWADMRAAAEADELKSKISLWDYYQITGHRLSSAYAAFKLMWVRNNQPEIYRNTYKTLCPKDYLIFRFTGNFVTDYSDASGTGVWDLRKKAWSDKLIDLCGLEGDKFPTALRSTDIAGYITKEAALETGLPAGCPIICGAGDGPCAAVGTGAIREGIANSCIGTSSWISMTSSLPSSDSRMISVTWPHIVPDKYMQCGAMQCGGGSLEWTAGNLCRDIINENKGDIRSTYADINKIIAGVPAGAKGLIYLPYLIGERSPWWNADAKGAFVGITYEHGRSEMMRAVMEGVALNLGIVFDSMKDCGVQAEEIVCVGGGAKSEVWRQIFADVYKTRIVKPEVTGEATSVGAIITAGVGSGIFKDFTCADAFVKRESETEPILQNSELYDRMKLLFLDTYHALEPYFPVYSSIL